MVKVYLAVPIIANRDLNQARLLSRTIEEMGHHIVSTWVTRNDPGFTTTPHKVFERDVKGVEECDILVAEISHRSHGVGMEIMQAHLQGKTIICLLSKGVNVSRMILGLPHVHLIEYTSEREMVEKVKYYLRMYQ